MKRLVPAVRLARALFLLLLLPGCALMQTGPATPIGGGNQQAFQAHQLDLAALQSWRVKARMASGVVGWSGNLDWRQQGRDLLLTVAGPLGVGGMRAEGSLDHVRVETSDQQRYSGDPEFLFHKLIGWPFPVKGMRYWALGMPMPNSSARTELDADGLLRVMHQAGWQVEYLEYREYLGYQMPRKMRLDNGDISVRVVIDNWLELSDRV